MTEPVNSYGQTFDQWKAVVNSIIEDTIGLSCDDLENYNYRDDFDDDEIPSETVNHVLAANCLETLMD